MGTRELPADFDSRGHAAKVAKLSDAQTAPAVVLAFLNAGPQITRPIQLRDFRPSAEVGIQSYGPFRDLIGAPYFRRLMQPLRRGQPSARLAGRSDCMSATCPRRVIRSDTAPNGAPLL